MYAGTRAAPRRRMANQASTWNDIKQLADQIELRIHLGTLEAHDRWRALRPRIDRIEKSLHKAGSRVADSLEHEMAEVRGALRALRDETLH